MENQTLQNFDTNSEKEMLAEILENTRKTRNYIKWQMIITIALVVLPILGVLVMVPLALNSINSTISPYTELLQ